MDEIFDYIRKEQERQITTINLIPSENYASKAVMEAVGTVLGNKYSEGYPEKRYYQGNEFVDKIELLAIERAKQLFGAEHVNVQSYSGSPANLAVFFTLLEVGDKFMGMRLDMGGHLTHGSPVNFSGKYYTPVPYTVDKETGLLDMDQIKKIAQENKPRMIISGYTAYPRTIPFKEFHEIAESVDAYSFADISHIAGLVAGGAHPSPFPFTDVVMTTTHKTLRGPRGGMIMCKKEDRLANVEGLDEKQAARKRDLAARINKSVFPGLQGGPHNNIIAGKAVAFAEALKPDFKDYAHQIVKNAKALAEELMSQGIKLVSDGTDNHLLLIDLTPMGVGLGKSVAVALEEAGICLNCNTIPYDPSTPFKPSGLRIGTPILTTIGMKESEMKQVGQWIASIIKDRDNAELKQKTKQEVAELCKEFKFY
ncbi:MAG: serine hydroxymethyltransferase [Candidatus Aenigmatarchaeota archaeon]|nr:serine hydroxymethyltransferase [Nanoarchaeota archaeon]